MPKKTAQKLLGLENRAAKLEPNREDIKDEGECAREAFGTKFCLKEFLNKFYLNSKFASTDFEEIYN